MSFFIKIRRTGALKVPAGFDYRPVNASDPDSISLSGREMSAAIGLMRAVDVLDLTIEKPSHKKRAAAGKVPLFKFQLSDGHHVTAGDSQLIVDAFAAAAPIDAAFLAARFPKFDVSRADLVKRAVELADLWIAFNRVAAVNDGYTVG